MAALTGLVLSALLVGCSGSDLGAAYAEASAELERGHAVEAERLCNDALLREDIAASDMHRWQLQWTRLRALAQAGRGADALLNLTHLDTRDSDHVDAERIARLVRDACQARDWAGAHLLVKHGRERYPERGDAWDGLGSFENLDNELAMLRYDHGGLLFRCTYGE